MNICFTCGNIGFHSVTCSEHPSAGMAFLDYPDGIGDVRFHQKDGSSFVKRRVQVDSIGGAGPHGSMDDTVGEDEDGNVFHVPNVQWWEVIFE